MDHTDPGIRICSDAIHADSNGRSGDEPLLTIIVPTFNEAPTIDAVLQKVVRIPCHPQIVVVDDGSTDETPAILKTREVGMHITVLRHERNLGKGAAIRTALPYAKGRFTVIQDADLEVNPEDIPDLLQPLLAGSAQVVYGSRYLGLSKSVRSWTFLRLGVYVLNTFVRLWYGVRLTDEATCYKVLSTDSLRIMDLQCERFEFCPEVTAKACRLGLSIVELPVQYQPRSKKAGKKLRLGDGLKAIRTLWAYRHWNPREYSNRDRYFRRYILSKSLSEAKQNG